MATKYDLPQTSDYINKYLRYQELYLKANKTQAEIDEMNSLFNDLSAYLITASDFNNKVEKTGDTVTDLQFNDANTKLLEGASNAVRIQTNSGYVDVGPQNTSYAHIYTDRAQFYVNKDILVNGNKVWHAGNDGPGSGLDADYIWDISGAKIKQALSLLGLLATIDGNATFSSNASLDAPVKLYNNLTINSGVTVTVPYSPTFILVKNTLTLNGNIVISGTNGSDSSYGGEGGRGGGVLIVIARTIIGTGALLANGGNGGNGLPYSGSGDTRACSVSSSLIMGSTITQTGLGPKVKLALANPFIFQSGDCAAMGGRGSYDGHSSYYYGEGGNGAGGAYGSGGSGGTDDNATYGMSGGGGGGGGGIIMLYSASPVPSITLQAKGGNGGNGASNGGGGGGGGGGFIAITAPGSSATISVAGGAGGSGYTSGSSGTAGLSVFCAI